MSSQATANIINTVNTFTTGDQTDVRISALSDGGWVAVWTSFNQQNDPLQGIRMQRYDVNGVAIEGEKSVNAGFTAGAQQNAAITGLAGGGWVVTWESDGGNGNSNVFYQVYNALGQSVGLNTQLNVYTTNNQTDVKVTALADGSFVATWTSVNQEGFNQGLPAGGFGIYQRHFAANGVALDVQDRLVYDGPYTANDQTHSDITALAGGGWVVTWASTDPDEPTGGIFRKVYDNEGDVISTQKLVNTFTTDAQSENSVSSLEDGGFIVTWTSNGQDGSGKGIFQQRYTADGTVYGVEQQVNTYTTNDQSESSVVGLSDGGWVVTWTGVTNIVLNNQPAVRQMIYQQRYDKDGYKVGGETLVDSQPNGDKAQTKSSVTAFAEGGWEVTWQTETNLIGEPIDIHQRRFAADILGTNGADNLAGTAFDETLISFEGNDRLDGKGGNDIMLGGAGNDTYIVDSVGDVVEEALDRGNDTVYSKVDYTIKNNLAIENILLTGTAVNAEGNANRNLMAGNASGNKLIAFAGDDILNGGAGVDTMYGGLGNDTYFVDVANDRVSESGGGGIDLVRSSAAKFQLGAGVENIVVYGLGLHATGNTLSNKMFGNARANSLNGGSGNDFIYGGSGNDKLIGGYGADLLNGQAGNDRIYGGDGNDKLLGYDGRDFLDGGRGGDSLTGGRGNDIYMVDNRKDVVKEYSNAGNDTINSSVNFTLSSNTETLHLTGSARNGTGNSSANVITGNLEGNILDGRRDNDYLFGDGGADRLLGGDGDDKLEGGVGSDILVGGRNNDTFIFNGRFGEDTIKDFLDQGRDKIDLRAVTAVKNFADLVDNHLNVNGSDIILTVGTGTIVLENVSETELQATSFIF